MKTTKEIQEQEMKQDIDQALKCFDNGEKVSESLMTRLVDHGILVKDSNEDTGYSLNKEAKGSIKEMVEYFEEGIA